MAGKKALTTATQIGPVPEVEAVPVLSVFLLVIT